MTSPAWLLALETGRAVVVRAGADELALRTLEWSGDAAALTATVREALDELGYGGEAVALGLDSGRVYAAQVASDGLPRKGRREALAFRLEEHLPLDAEGLTADFLPAEGGRALGVAVETQGLRAILDALAERGVAVDAVCPTALLALWQALRGQNVPADLVIVADEHRADIFRLVDGRPVAWTTAPAEAQALVRAVQADLLAHPTDGADPEMLIAGPLPETLAETLRRETGLALHRTAEDTPVVALAAAAAAPLLREEGAGWVNLARGALARPDRLARVHRPLKAVLALGLALLAVVAAGAAWRTWQYECEADRLVEAQRGVFARLYPNTAVPVGVRRWLASEDARLAGVSGAGAVVPEPHAAIERLRQVVAGLPADLRLRVVDVRIDPAEVYVEGQARSHADAEKIGRGIGGQGLAMDPPRTENLAGGGVAFTLVGRPGEAAKAAPREARP
jgi:type II secretory pathway component PulL